MLGTVVRPDLGSKRRWPKNQIGDFHYTMPFFDAGSPGPHSYSAKIFWSMD